MTTPRAYARRTVAAGPLTRHLLRLDERLRYELDIVRVIERELAPYTHLCATRAGLLAVNRTHWTLVMSGQFFGLTVRNGAIYCFEAFGAIDNLTRQRGRIVELRLGRSQRIEATRVVISGLPNGCHQIDFIGDDLFVCDTYNSRLLRFDRTFKLVREIFPTGRHIWNDFTGGYPHLNSVVAYGDYVYLLLNNGTSKSHKPSELARSKLATLDTWERQHLPGGNCHNIVFLEDGSAVVCDSLSGQLVNLSGTICRSGSAFTRGLSVGRDEIVVGNSPFMARASRRTSTGEVAFFSRRFEHQITLPLPAAPTDLRRIDGEDLSLSNHARNDRVDAQNRAT